MEDTDGALATRAPTESGMAFVSRAVAHRRVRYPRKHGVIDADAITACRTAPTPVSAA